MAIGNRKAGERDKELGDFLRRLRKMVDLSQESVAAEFQISQQQYWKYENGISRMPAEFFENVCNLLENQARERGLVFSETRPVPLLELRETEQSTYKATTQTNTERMRESIAAIRRHLALLEELSESEDS